MSEDILNVIDGQKQILIKVPAELEPWYFVPASAAYTNGLEEGEHEEGL